MNHDLDSLALRVDGCLKSSHGLVQREVMRDERVNVYSSRFHKRQGRGVAATIKTVTTTMNIVS